MGTLEGAPTRRAVPPETPMRLVTDAWQPDIRESGGSISRRYYELCTWWSLWSALRAGSVWVGHGRRYTDPDTYLIPPLSGSASGQKSCARRAPTPKAGTARCP